MKLSRREFIKTAGAFMAGGIMGAEKLLGILRGGKVNSSSGSMPVRELGKTGHKVSIFSLGGEAAVESSLNPGRAEDIINRGIDLGVNYIDTAPLYGRTASETNIGRVMKERRKEVFLATKTAERSYSGTMRSVEESLRRLSTDRIDLYQLHSIRTEGDLRRVFASDGAVKALDELKEAGVIGYTGITGHYDPGTLIKGIESYGFDCILMTLNAGDPHYRPFQEELLEKAVQKEMGIIAMKVTARGRIFREEGITSMEEALGYALSFPVSTAIVGISGIGELEENVRIAREFKPFSDEELERLSGLTRSYSQEANFFKHRW